MRFGSQVGNRGLDKTLVLRSARTVQCRGRQPIGIATAIRLLQHKIAVKMEFDIRTNFDERTDSVNVIGQIDGGRKKDEVVMIGAHLDSWQGGTGATDNGAGCSVMLETMRILKTLNLKLDRSVRIALWSGEEENLLGSTAYVKQHFADRATMKPTRSTPSWMPISMLTLEAER